MSLVPGNFTTQVCATLIDKSPQGSAHGLPKGSLFLESVASISV